MPDTGLTATPNTDTDQLGHDSVTQLVEQIIEEGPIGMSQAARCYGTYRQGRPTAASTLTRHALHGVRLPDGRVVKLGAIRCAGRLMTSKSAIIRFLAAQNQQPTEDSPPAPTPARRQRAAAAASSELNAILGTAN